MRFEQYIYSGTRRLRRGYTTGSCAALAAKAATVMLLSGAAVHEISIMTPKGIAVCVDVVDVHRTLEGVSCAVVKDGGDDYDVTDGASVYVHATRIAAGVEIDGGEGVGRVTLPGLDQPVGEAAINRVPRAMIAEAVREVCVERGYTGGVRIVVSVPEGRRLAEKTFNPRLGIEGGISILGTTGIVEPQSLQALLDTIETEVKMRAAQSRRLVLTPGSYGEAFLKTFDMPQGVPRVTCSNFIGATLDLCAVNGFEEVLLASHIGKLVKVAGGIMDTHSRTADCRCEIFCAHAAMAGADTSTARELMAAPTTDGCLDILSREELQAAVLESLSTSVQDHLDHRAAGAFRIGAVAFSNKSGHLFTTSVGQELLDEWRIR